MFLSKEDLKSSIYNYQLEDITDGDDEIVEMAIAAAIEETKSYLTLSNAVIKDGRLKYNVAAAFAATGAARHPLLLSLVKTIAVWHIIQLSNTDIVYDKLKDRYDRAITYLDTVNSGKANMTLPLITAPVIVAQDQSQDAFRYGSRVKFNHE